MHQRLAIILAIALAFSLAPAAPAEAAVTYTVDPVHSEVSFRIRHFVSRVRGQFRDFSGTIVKDDENPAASSIELVIQAASIDTDHERRDNHLRSADFFDVEKYPTIRFESTAVERADDGAYRVTGTLSMHGVTKVLTLPVTFEGEMPDGQGGYRAAFSTSRRLDRKDFNIVWNRVLDQGGRMLGDDVEIEINLAAVRK